MLYVRDTKSYVRHTKSYVRDIKSYVRDTKYEFLFVPVNFYFPFKLKEVKGHMSEQRAAERVRQSPTQNCCMVRVTNDNSA